MPENNKINQNRPEDYSPSSPAEEKTSSLPPLPGEEKLKPSSDMPSSSTPSPPSEEASSLPPPPPPMIVSKTPPKKTKLIAGLTVLFFLLVCLPVALFLVRQKQEIEKKAEERQLICMPIDENGNITNDKYHHNRIKVINNTDKNVILWIQENLCDYQGQDPAPPYECTKYAKRYSDTIATGQEKIYSIDVPCEKIGQLDVAQDDEAMGTYTPDCYNPIDGKIWEGGIAFTIQANKEACPVPTACPSISLAISPNPAQPGETLTFTAYSDYALACVELDPGGGIQGSLSNFRVEGKYYWKWNGKAVNSPGNFTATFRGNTQDSGSGNCPERAIGAWCPITTNYTIASTTPPPISPTPQPTPTLTPTPTISPSPSVSPEEYGATCDTCRVYDEEWNEIKNLSSITVGQTVYFTTQGTTNHPQGLTKARFRINAGDWQETTDKYEDKFYIQYKIPFLGTYKVEAMVYNPELGWY